MMTEEQERFLKELGKMLASMYQVMQNLDIRLKAVEEWVSAPQAAWRGMDYGTFDK